MRNYELTFIVASDVDEQEYNGILAQAQKWVEESSGQVVKTDQWGRRRLAYPIGEFNEGYYVTLFLDMEPHTTAELERNLRLNERIIRHLLIRSDED
jgi:small subunit ribosomal protein S6